MRACTQDTRRPSSQRRQEIVGQPQIVKVTVDYGIRSNVHYGIPDPSPYDPMRRTTGGLRAGSRAAADSRRGDGRTSRQGRCRTSAASARLSRQQRGDEPRRAKDYHGVKPGRDYYDEPPTLPASSACRSCRRWAGRRDRARCVSIYYAVVRNRRERNWSMKSSVARGSVRISTTMTMRMKPRPWIRRSAGGSRP